MRHRDLATGLVTLLLFIIAFLRPNLFSGTASAIERFGKRLAHRKRLALLAVAVAAIVLRLSVLWAVPVPVPSIHDEFSYLLAADTFSHGRLTNPPHSMWIYFDTFHVNQFPTYMSKYPPAQGAVLALGEILGSPWIGVLISVSAMCAAVLWALQGWFPPEWALLGSVLVLFRFGIWGYWINSYWGGAMAAIGGALVVGALPRIIHSRRPRDAVVLGCGAAILANSRPFEGLIFCLPVAIVLGCWLLRRTSPGWRVTLPRVVLPCGLILLLCGSFMAYYNHRVTGNAFLLPYSVNDLTYLSTPPLAWQKIGPPRRYLNPQFDAFYNGWGRRTWETNQLHGIGSGIRAWSIDVIRLAYFFLWPEFGITLLAALYSLSDRRMRFLIAQSILCITGFLLVAWPFQPHYAAPLTVTIFALVTQAIRHFRKWRFRGRPIGLGFSRAIPVAAALLIPFHSWNISPDFSMRGRANLAASLSQEPGNQLVIVHYAPNHDALDEWVYNAADIDHAKLVWAREIPGVPLQPLLNYFHDRHVWIVEADENPPKVLPYAPSIAP
jgi:hypothetical protein